MHVNHLRIIKLKIIMKLNLLTRVFNAHFIVFLFLVYLFNNRSFGQAASGVSVNNTNTPAHPSAMLDVSSTSSPFMGMLIPRMTTADRNSIANPATGLQVF